LTTIAGGLGSNSTGGEKKKKIRNGCSSMAIETGEAHRGKLKTWGFTDKAVGGKSHLTNWVKTAVRRRAL